MTSNILSGLLPHKRALARKLLSRTHCCTPIPRNMITASKPRCPVALSTASLAASLYSRPNSRGLHPPGPLATFQGSAQVAGLLKERSQDYFVATTDVAYEGGLYCSQTSWADSACDDNGHVTPNAFSDCKDCGGNGCGSAAACSTSDSGTGLASSSLVGGTPSIVITGVFDGHGGEMSARYAQQAVVSYVAADRGLHTSLGSGDVEATAAALRDIFRRVDSELLSLASAGASSSASALSVADPPAASAAAAVCHGPGCTSDCPTTIAVASKPGSFKPALAAVGVGVPSSGGGGGGGDFHDGTTALVTLQLGGLLAVANAGDSRAVLCRAGQAVRLSRDHTPALRAERERIEAAGGQVVVARGAARVLVPLPGSNRRVMQALSVSRSLGDPDFKAAGTVIADPDVSVVPLEPGADSFLIAASDGLWGRVSDQEAVDCAGEVLQEYARMSPLHRESAAKAAARRLLRLALDQGSVDDVTVVVSVFAWSP